MRPVNLIPPEERRDKAAIRTGPIAYLLVGALALGLIAVTMLVLTGNKISDRKSDVAKLHQEVAATQAQATQYASFTNFAGVERTRHSTIKSLANSRFDWQRVLEEMSRVIPSDVWLTKLSGSTTGASATGSSIDTTSITGPSLDIQGCAANQDDVASFIAALRDIDGVTRVGLSRSDITDPSTTAGASDAAGADSTGCTSRKFLAQFEVIAAFDAVPTPAVAGAAPATTTSTPATTDGSTSTDSSSTDSSSTTTTPDTTTPASDSGT